jgi:hypothetical protein
MTRSTHPPLTDERLDRLVRNALADRAEDVFSMAVSADLMTERIAMRPGFGTARPLTWRNSPAGLTLLIVIGLLLAGMVAALVIGSWPRLQITGERAVIGQVVDAVNSRDVAALRSSFAAGANVVLAQIRSDGLQEDAASVWEVATDNFLEAWMSSIDAWDMEAELRSCQADTESIFRCDVTTRWHVMQVEIGEEWTFEFDGLEVTRLEMARVEPNPTNRTLPLGYHDLASWESWLEETHPEQAARLSGNDLMWPFYFRYHHEDAEAIGASIQEYLESRRQP